MPDVYPPGIDVDILGRGTPTEAGQVTLMIRLLRHTAFAPTRTPDGCEAASLSPCGVRDLDWSAACSPLETAMRTIEAEEAQTRFAEVLNEVENGETVIVTRDGQPVARVSPARQAIDDAAAAMEETHRLRRDYRPMLDGITLRELIEHGRDRRFEHLTRSQDDEDDRGR